MSVFLLCKTSRPFRVLITLLCMVFGLFTQAQTVTIGAGTATQRYPLGSFFGFERSASLYTAAEIGVPAGGSVLSVAWNSTAATSVNLPVKIYIKSVPSATTTLTSQDWATSTTGATLVYTGNIASLPTGWNTVTLQNSHYYNGTDNLVVLVETNFGGSGGGTSAGGAITYTTATSRHMYIQQDTTAPTGTGTTSGSRPNVQLTFGPAPTCIPPSGVTLGTVTTTSAFISWTAPSSVPAGGYDVYYTTSPTAPTTATPPSQTITTGTSTTLSPLIPNTTYYVWVRSRCSATDQSTWMGPVTVLTGYCTPSAGTSSQTYYLNNITTTGGISNLNYTANSFTGYVDNSASTVLAIPTGSVAVNLTTSGTSTYHHYIWVDWNNNMNFNDPGETILATTAWTASATGTIAIPAGQPAGNYRVRTATTDSGTLTPCGPAPWGNYVDFTLSVISLQPCNAAVPPTNITVTNVTPSTALVSWIPTIGGTYVVRYRPITGGAWTTVNINTALTSTTTLLNLTESTQYEVQIATVCGGTTGAFSSSVNFTTPALTYCTANPTGTTTPSGYISNVTVTPTNAPLMVSASAYDGYKDYFTDPTRVVTLVRNSSNNKISVTKYYPATSSSYAVVAWIDYNRNGIFEVGEKILDTTYNTTTPVTNNNFTVPALPNVYNGTLTTRMRVIMRYFDVPQACGTFSEGEVEDYAVRFIDQPVCSTAAPTGLTVSNLTATTATFSWVAATGATYSLRYRKVGSGTAGWVTVDPVPAPGNVYTTPATPGLTEQTQYEVQVATRCSGTLGGYSTLVPFTTPPISYCQMTGTGTNDHIANVTVTSSNPGVPVMNNTSVQTNYISYNTPATLITLDANSINNKISVAKGWLTSTNSDAVTAWIDFNRNGVFEASEQILTSPSSTTTPVFNNSFSVPAGAYTGPLTTTMRVVLRRTSAPVMCSNPVNGEVEDYAVRIRPCSNALPNAPVFTPTHNSVSIALSGSATNVSYLVRYRAVATPPGAWIDVYASTLLGNIPLVINGLIPATTYEVQVATVCGDVIGAFTPIKTFVTRCDPTPPNVTISNITTNSALITWAPLSASSTYTVEWRKVGTTTWTQINNIALPTNTYLLGGLDPYTKYEVRVANKCVGENTLNPYSNPKVFTTERICDLPPPGFTILQLFPTWAEVTWEGFPGATYILRYRKVGIPSWTNVPLTTNTHTITGLLEETKYEMQVVNVCNGTPGTYTPPYYFTTPTVVYCQMGSLNSVNEHISKVTVVPNGRPKMENASGPSSYTNYTGVPATFIEMVQGSTGNQITIEKKWNGTNHDEGVAVWIDFNRNGSFDIDEMVFSSPPNTTSPVTGTFNVPVDAFVSMTNYKYVVMRVALMRDGIPVNCTNFANGEVEDYSVRISKPGVPNSVNQTDILIYPNPVSSVLYVKNISKRAKYKIYNAAGQVIGDGILLNNQINVSKLINGVYVIDIEDDGKTVQKKFIKE
ncbi:GEVED domain-containing protein [Chryseobacterium vrystaatense]|nr:GEVED domain-containing protein [Chryseobacterium vrystaatense]